MAVLVLTKNTIGSLIQSRIQICFGIKTVNNYSTKKSGANKKDPGGYYKDSREIKTVQLAFIAIENIRPSVVSNKCPVLIMHEVMDSKSHWINFAKALHYQTKRKVYAVDARNHGDSFHAKEMTYVHISEDIKKLMEEMRIEKCCVIGHGMGGRAAMALALRYPRIIERLVVIDASPASTSGNHHLMAKYIDAIGTLTLGKNLNLTNARRSIESQLASVVTEDIVRFILTQNLIPADVVGMSLYKWRVNMLSIIVNFYNISTFPMTRGKVVCEKPALFIYGENVGRLGALECMEIRLLFPNSQFAGISDAGHWVHSQNPQEFLACVLGFFDF